MKRLILISSVAAAVAASTLAACASPRPLAPLAADAAPAERARYNARVFDAVWSLVDERYYDPRAHGLDWRRVRDEHRPQAIAARDVNALYGVLTAMLDRLGDAHAYVQSPPEVLRAAQSEAARPLFGLRLRRQALSYIVDDVRPGGPADLAGVEAGWTLETSDGAPYDVTVSRRAGVPERLGFRDAEGRAVAVELRPQMTDLTPQRQVARRADGVWVVRFDDFEPGAADWLFKAMTMVPPGTPLVLDLRDNTGGRVTEVERALGCFIPPQTVIARMRPRSGRERVSLVRADCAPAATGPLVVLVDRRSRSGAEMFAAAVQERRRGLIVGGRTSGALLSSLRHPLPDGGVLTLSEADFVTASGRRIERIGLAPDVLAAVTQADRRAGRDPAMAAAVALLQPRQDAAEQVSAPALESPE